MFDLLNFNRANDDSMMETLQCNFLGYVNFSFTGRTVTIKSRKAEALLGYLCLSGGRLLREKAAGMFWSESSEYHARSSLRQTLLILKRALSQVGYNQLTADKTMIYLPTDSINLDTHQLLGAIERGDVQTSWGDSSFLGEIFVGFDGVDEVFTQWLRELRNNFQNELRSRLEPRLRPVDGNWEAAHKAAEVLLMMDPAHEPACQAYMRARAACGDFAGAIKAYDAFWRVLDEDYDTLPGAETQALAVAIKLGEFNDPSISSNQNCVGGGARKIAFEESADDLRPRIVIISRDELQGGKRGEDESLGRLKRKVISRFVRFRDVATASERAARAEDYRLELEIFSQSDGAHVLAVLKQDSSQTYLWGEEYSACEFGGCVVSDDLCDRLVRTFHAYVISACTRASLAESSYGQTTYAKYALAHVLLSRHSPQEGREAEKLLREVVDQNPNFTPAIARLVVARANWSCRRLEQGEEVEDWSRLRLLAERAYKLDPSDGWAALSLGWAELQTGSLIAAVRSFTQATRLNDCDIGAGLSSAFGLALCGERELALKSACSMVGKQGLDLTTADVGALLAVGYFSAWRDFVEVDLLEPLLAGGAQETPTDETCRMIFQKTLLGAQESGAWKWPFFNVISLEEAIERSAFGTYFQIKKWLPENPSTHGERLRPRSASLSFEDSLVN